MSDEIMLVFGEDGVAREYDDTWDITIHCESEEEQKAVLEKLNNSNQEAKTQLSAEGTTNLQPTCNNLEADTISRQAAIDRIVWWFGILKQNPDILIDSIKTLPSAHPEIEERKEESAQNVPKEDLISRKAAIDAINKALDRETLLNSFVRKVAVDALKTMPSAQPEPCESDEAAKRLNDLIFDINPAEICAQIEADNLKKWCEIIQVEMKMAMVQLPCWGERRTDAD